jgi:hypothetical protein
LIVVVVADGGADIRRAHSVRLDRINHQCTILGLALAHPKG